VAAQRTIAREYVTAAILGLACCTVSAQTVPPGGSAGPSDPPPFDVAGDRSIRLFPSGDIYPVYVADPHRPTNAAAFGFYSRTEVDQTASPRPFLAGGGRIGMLRIESSAPDGRFWQVSLEAGLDAMFDNQHRNDAVGWDGNYGFTVTTAAAGSTLGWKAAILHVSSHLGDEYAERTGAVRVDYTREEAALGVAWQFRPRWRAYAELGVAYLMRSEAQQRGRWQGGVEYEAPPAVFGGRLAWYGALDLSAMSERDWRVDHAVQGGLVMRTSGHAYRLYVQWYNGRVPLGQFVQQTEASLAIGMRLDL
jgi:hypothetical protein